MRRWIYWIFALILFIPGTGIGFDLVEYSPLLSHYEVLTTENAILVFDAPIDAATATSANVYLEPRDGGDPLAASVSVTTTYSADDTVVIDPAAKLPFGVPLRFVIGAGLEDTLGGTFSGSFPSGEWFVPNVPTDLDRPAWDPQNFTGVFVNSNVLLGFNPLDPESTDPSEPWMVPGIAATEAWKIHTGRPEVIIAAVDNGLSTYDDKDLIERFFLNAGELPLPQNGSSTCAQYDCNDDGRFSVSDYAQDPRLPIKGLNPMDLIEAFSDGVDDDNNGYPDDICGYDFFRNTNTALGVKEFREGTHASLSGKAAVAIAGNGSGDKPGVCPDCTLLPMRVSDAVIADFDLMAEGARYATEMGAKVLMVALGSVDYSRESEDIFTEAFEKGVITIAASGDELGFHHLWPAAGEDVIDVHAVLPIPAVELGPLNLGFAGFTESYCTNYGAHISHTVSTGACTSEAVGNGAGLAGLIYSYGLERGYDLTAAEVTQIMNLSADDVESHCITLTPGGCKPGWDQHWGYGRVNAFNALKVLGWPEMGIEAKLPPSVRITQPRWWANVDPFVDSMVTVEGQISARGETVNYELQFALGVEPDDADFAVVATGSGTDIDGMLGTVDLWDFVSEQEVRARPDEPNAFTVTLRVQAWYSDKSKAQIFGETRKSFAVHSDRDEETGLIDEGFPYDIEASGEASPVLYDLDGAPDGRPEIILATSNGLVTAYHFNNGIWEPAPGFPVELPNDRAFPDGVVGTPAVGQLFGDGVPIIVAATFMGRVFAIWPDGNNHAGGPFVPGFPVEAMERPNDTALEYGHGRSFLAAPLLSDLDGDGLLEIVAASYDQHVYAWKPVDENDDDLADDLAGWPVLARSESGVVPNNKVCDYPLTAQILGSPAAALLDPDNDDPDIADYPAIIVPTGEVCENNGKVTSRVYAIYHNGYDHPDGPFLPGWPAMLLDPAGDEIPIPPLTIGATSSPAVYYDEKKDKAYIGAGAFFWFPFMLVYEDEKLTPLQLFSSRANLGVSANGTWGRMDDTDEPYYFFPSAGFVNRTDGVFLLESFNVCGWKLDRWNRLAFRKRLDDMNFFINPNVADLNNDGMAEVISGSSGYIIHAWNIDGDTPPGWPKFTQNFQIGSVAVGDIDLDGKTDVVSYTHEGNLFAWKTLGKACKNRGLNSDWWSFHHDEYNTGTLGVDTIPPGLNRDFKVFTTDDPDTFNVQFTSSGDDWQCGFADAYDLRFTTDAGDDLVDNDIFLASMQLETGAPEEPGSTVTFIVTAPGAKKFALRTVDDQSLLGQIATAEPQAPGTDDDDDDFQDDDDTDDDSAGGNDDDDNGCCG